MAYSKTNNTSTTRSGQTLNKSSERIVLSFNTSFKGGGVKN